MNRNIVFCLALLFFCSCSSDKKSAEKAVPEVQVKSAVQIDPKTQQLENLKKATPSSLEDLEKLVPEKLADIKRTKIFMTSNLGYATVRADYEKNSKTYVHLAIFDCTGEMGTQLFNNNYLSYINNDAQDADGYRKTIELFGGKAIEKYDDKTKVSTLRFFTNGKVLVELSGKNIDFDQIKAAAGEMNLKAS